MVHSATNVVHTATNVVHCGAHFESAPKIFLVLAQGKAQEVHGNYFNGLFKKNSCLVQLGHLGTQLGLKTSASS